ncbi:hypothetical protein [Mechercharimyces sp. CAU 1602]|uniref:hypothetical protein n=1 Tax=Mechercharimyces sp. CAU 1602 TaxID=2973933 RepID=UPI0021623301|nr:hypothetical protein [Mechercharimyces sp. CAU 1602]MCS1351763.1 hypothetical protein [Mechercharimyces sp. CAU 1602]
MGSNKHKPEDKERQEERMVGEGLAGGEVTSYTSIETDEAYRTKQDQKEECCDHEHEGRDRYFLDVDRMMNEGMAGGIVSAYTGVDEGDDLKPEEKPKHDK